MKAMKSKKSKFQNLEKNFQKKFFFENLILVGLDNKISAKFIENPISETVVNVGQKSTKNHQKCAKVVEKRSIK